MTFYEERLGKDLGKIQSDVQDLGAKVVQALQDAVHALLTENRGLANRVILGDNVINRGSPWISRGSAETLPSPLNLMALISSRLG